MDEAITWVCILNCLYINTEYTFRHKILLQEHLRNGSQWMPLGRRNESCGWGMMCHCVLFCTFFFFYHVHITFPIGKKKKRGKFYSEWHAHRLWGQGSRLRLLCYSSCSPSGPAAAHVWCPGPDGGPQGPHLSVQCRHPKPAHVSRSVVSDSLRPHGL